MHTVYTVFTSYKNQECHFVTEKHIERKEHPTHTSRRVLEVQIYNNHGIFISTLQTFTVILKEIFEKHF